jgi:hypothetical protein
MPRGSPVWGDLNISLEPPWGGCDRVKTLVGELSSGGARTVMGATDWDGKAVSGGSVVVMGEGKRYSLENYLFDPVLLAALLLREKILDRNSLNMREGENFVDLKELSSERLQAVCDAVLRQLSWEAVDGRCDECEYMCGLRVMIPRALLHKRGHALEADLRARFKELGKFKRADELKVRIVDTVVDDVPELVSKDFLEFFRRLQTFDPNGTGSAGAEECETCPSVP